MLDTYFRERGGICSPAEGLQGSNSSKRNAKLGSSCKDLQLEQGTSGVCRGQTLRNSLLQEGGGWTELLSQMCCGSQTAVRVTAAGHSRVRGKSLPDKISSCREESAASKTCSIRERGNLRCKPSSAETQYKPCAVTRVNTGGRAEPFLQAGRSVRSGTVCSG